MVENYFRIEISHVPSVLEDVLTSFCFEWGASGISEKLDFVQVSERYEPEIIPKEMHTLDVFFERYPGEDFFAELQARFPQVSVQSFKEEQRDWLAEWKKGFKPFLLADGVWIVPSWEPIPPEAHRYLHLDPGMAFGTGLHATTRLASEMLMKHLQGAEESLLDVGTGTGILAMLARLKGVKQVVTTEIDPVAREVAKENIQLNGLTGISVLDVQVESLQQTFPWVVANIIDGVLLDLEPHLVRALKPGGKILLTGILLEREEHFLKHWSTPLRQIERLQLSDWVGFLMEKPT